MTYYDRVGVTEQRVDELAKIAESFINTELENIKIQTEEMVSDVIIEGHQLIKITGKSIDEMIIMAMQMAAFIEQLP